MEYTVGPVARPLSSFGAPQAGVSPNPSQRVLSAKSLPMFQPAPSHQDVQAKASQDLDPQKAPAIGTLAQFGINYFMSIVGTILLSLVVLTPIWDATRLLYSSTFVYFMGRSFPSYIIGFCCAILLFFILTMVVMERSGRTKADEMNMATCTITTLGLGLLLLAVPLHVQTRGSITELLVSVNSGARTKPLWAYYNTLLDLRLKPDCLNKTSVEECHGFQRSAPYTGFLKHMELGYFCSGFGYAVDAHNISKSTLSPRTAVLAQQSIVKEESDFMGLLQFPTPRLDSQGLYLLAANPANLTKTPVWEKMPRGFGDTTNNMASTGWMQKYPPTLFTNANYKSSCEGAAARDLRFTAQETATLLELEGAALLLVSVAVGFMKLCAMCRSPEDFTEYTPENKLAAPQGHYQRYTKQLTL